MKIIIILLIVVSITSIIINALVLKENIRKEKVIKRQKELISKLVKFRKERRKKEK